MNRRLTGWIMAAMAVFVGSPLLKLLGRPDSFLVWPAAIFSDLLTSHLPLATFIHQALLRWAAPPLWNPIMLGGQPLVGDPLAGLSYPPLWLTYLWPSAAAFELLFAVHLTWLGLGAYLLGRRYQLRPLASVVMAAALAATPRVWGHWGLGHVTLTFAFCWTPWILLALESALAASVDRVDWLRFGVAGAVLGVTACADPRWALPSGLLAVLYLAWRLAYSHEGWRAWARRLGGSAFLGVISLGVSAWLLLPLLSFASQSTRAGLSAPELSLMSLSPEALLGLVLPDPAVWPEQMVSVGLLVILLAGLAFASGERRSVAFWAGVAVFGWLVALGDATPLFGIVQSVVPGMSLVRVPGRWSMLSSLALVVLAGYGFDSILGVEIPSELRRRGRLLLTALLSFVLFLFVALIVLLGPATLANRPAWGVTMLWGVIGGALLMVRLSGGRSSGLTLLIALLIPAELAVFNWQSLEARSVPAAAASAEGGSVREWGDGRLLSTSYVLPQLSAVERQIELAGGVAPLQLDRYWSFMADSLGFSADQYSVTLPPYPMGDPNLPGQLRFPADRLGWLNITEVAVPESVHEEGLAPIGPWRGSWLYVNQRARPRAWVQESVAREVVGPWQEALVEDWRPNHISVSASGPGRMVLAETYSSGWQATVDGEPTEIEPAAGVLRSILIPAGEHEIVFRFVPWPAIAGLVITALTWLALVGLWWRR